MEERESREGGFVYSGSGRGVFGLWGHQTFKVRWAEKGERVVKPGPERKVFLSFKDRGKRAGRGKNLSKFGEPGLGIELTNRVGRAVRQGWGITALGLRKKGGKGPTRAAIKSHRARLGDAMCTRRMRPGGAGVGEPKKPVETGMDLGWGGNGGGSNIRGRSNFDPRGVAHQIREIVWYAESVGFITQHQRMTFSRKRKNVRRRLKGCKRKGKHSAGNLDRVRGKGRVKKVMMGWSGERGSGGGGRQEKGSGFVR